MGAGVAASFVAIFAWFVCGRDAGIRLGEALSAPYPRTGHAKFVNVRASDDGSRCIVDRDEMRSDNVALHLKDDRRIAPSKSVVVRSEGTGNAAVARADALRWKLKAAGYSDVRTIGFLTSPGHPNPDPLFLV